MNAVVVYESLWGNTAEVARAIAEGLGPEARAVSTAHAPADVTAGADLLVAGAPTHVARMPTTTTREGAAKSPDNQRPPDLTHPPMREWLERLPRGAAAFAAFDTTGCIPPEAPLMKLWAKFGARNGLAKELRRKGYRPLAEPRTFQVEGNEGPLREGDLDRARTWGEELRRLLG